MEDINLPNCWHAFISSHHALPFKKILDKLGEIIHETLENVGINPSTENVHKLYNLIKHKKKSHNVSEVRLNIFFSRFISFCNERYATKIALLHMLVRPTREKNIITSHFLRSSSLMLRWWQQVYLPLINLPPNDFNKLSDEDLFKLTLISICINTGLTQTQYLADLASDITQDNLSFLSTGRHVWIELVRDKSGIKGYPTNLIVDSKPMHMRRVFLDFISLSLVLRLKERLKNGSDLSNFYQLSCRDDEVNLAYLLTINNSKIDAVKNFSQNQIINGFVRIFNFQHNDTVPATIIHYLNNQRVSVCCDQKSFISLFTAIEKKTHGHQVNIPEACQSVDDFDLTCAAGSLNQYERLSDEDMTPAIGMLRAILSKKPKVITFWHLTTENKYQKIEFGYTIKTSDQIEGAIHQQDKKEVIKQLQQLKSLYSNKSQALALIIKWYLHHLTHLGNRPSTVSTYHSIIFRAWFPLAHELDLSAMTPDDFYELYLGIILDADETKRSNLSAKLLQFHLFLFEYLAYQKLSRDHEKALRTFKNQIHVKTTLLSEQLFEETLIALTNIPSLDQAQRDKCKVAFILAYRAGFRMAEILSLQFSEIIAENDLVIVIRSNKFGKVKSQASYRNGRVGTLLTPKERDFIHTFINNTPKRSNKLLLTNEQSAISAEILNNIIKHTAAQYGLYATFHSLRHTAINRIHMLLTGLLETIPFLNPYSKSQISKIKDYFIGEHGIKNAISWQIASLAGHKNPDMSYSSYLHLTPLLIASYVNNYSASLTRDAIVNIAQVTERKATFIRKKKDKDVVIDLIDQVTKKVTLISKNYDLLDNQAYQNQQKHPYFEAVIPKSNKALDLFKFSKMIRTCLDKNEDYESYSKSFGTSSNHINDAINVLKERGITRPPTDSLTTNEKNIVTRLTIQFYSKNDQTRPGLQKLVDLYIKAEVSKKSYLKFYEFSELKTFLDLCADAIPYQDWHVKIMARNAAAIDKWTRKIEKLKQVLSYQDEITNTKKQSGFVMLRIYSHESCKRKLEQEKAQHSMRPLKYFVYYSFIFLYLLNSSPE